MPSKIEWLSGGDTVNPLKVRVRQDAAAIAKAKGYTSLVQIAERTAGKVGWHCEHVHRGCDNCYAEAMNHRCLPGCGTGLPYDRRSRDLVETIIDEKALMQPLKWTRGRTIFWCSMTDMFGEWVPGEHIDRLFAVMALTPHHRYIVLTKRPERMARYLGGDGLAGESDGRKWRVFQEAQGDLNKHNPTGKWINLDGQWPLPNVILGASASDQSTLDSAAPHLRTLAAAGWHTLLSYEPALGPINAESLLRDREPTREQIDDLRHGDYYLRHGAPWLSWVIAGAESGTGARPIDEDWVRSIRDQCFAAGVPFFYKQKTVGGKKVGTPELDGREWVELPEVLK